MLGYGAWLGHGQIFHTKQAREYDESHMHWIEVLTRDAMQGKTSKYSKKTYHPGPESVRLQKSMGYTFIYPVSPMHHIS